MNRETGIGQYYKIILAICSFSQLVLLGVVVYLLLHGDIPTLFNTMFYYMPCAFFLTIVHITTIVAASVNLKKKRMMRFSSKIKIAWIVCFCFCFFTISSMFFHPYASDEQKQNFKNCFSLQNLVSYTQDENWCFQYPTRKWGKTFYIQGGETYNTEKITAINMKPQTYQELPDCSAIYDVVVVKNVPDILLKEIQTAFLSDFNTELYSYLHKDLTNQTSFQYKEADITMYYDSHLDGESERLLFIAKYKQNFLMFNLIFQDTSNQIQINRDDILEKAVDYLKQ